MGVDGEQVAVLVEAHLVTVLGEPGARAGVTFLGTDRIDVLRFGPDPAGVVRYATVGMSRHPMGDPAAGVLSPDGPRGELLLSLADPRDDVFRALAVLAAAPAVEGLVAVPGASLTLGQPLWVGARFTAVLLGEPGQLVPDLPLDPPAAPVRFLPVLPMTDAEAAWRRVHGSAALQQRWLARGTDLRDPRRAAVPLDDATDGAPGSGAA